MRTLGLDVGSNSVGSAWVDTEKQEITLGVSVFPAGVDETDKERGAPKNQKRRGKRSQRRSIRRRANRKKRLRRLLVKTGLLPSDTAEMHLLFTYNIWPLPSEFPDKFMRTPWHLRREGLQRELTPYEFGRLLIHLNQRRGALGIETDSDDADEGKVKDAIDRTRQQLGDKTFGQMMADLLDDRTTNYKPIRNRRDSFDFHADRSIIRDEFHKLWSKQRAFSGPLSTLLTQELLGQLDDPREDGTWRQRGEIFGQRRTYWDTGTLGRCELEPTDHKCPIADISAQEYRVVETVNNIRIKARDERDWRPLTKDERDAVIRYLRGGWTTPQNPGKSKRQPKPKRAVKNPGPEHIREVLGIDKKMLGKRNIPENYYQLNLENDPDREINTNWFYRCVIHDSIGEECWTAMSDRQRESVNSAILKFDSDSTEHAEKLRKGAIQWWGLSSDAADRLVNAWKARPKIEKRVKLSRRAIQNLLPYMNFFDSVNNRWPTQIEARQRFAADSNNGASEHQRQRYALGASSLNKASRHFLRKHVNQLPPAPTLSNPVVRKTIHEVRRHVNEYLRRFNCRPDRVVIEFVRGVTETTKRRNLQLAANRAREKERKAIEEDLEEWGVPESNWKMAVLRVRLCSEQSGICPFSINDQNANRLITPSMAAKGRDVEIEHIIPESITGKTLDFNNVVLCFRNANQNKRKRTPLDWLGVEGVAEVLRRLEDSNVRKNKTKWNRLQAETPDVDAYRNSQLTDSAYAARQVAEYIASALFRDDVGTKRRVFTTKGEYTARLRADWALYESEIDRSHGLEPELDIERLESDPELEQTTRRARKDPTKDRIDHRHHALDALVVALTGPEILTKIGDAAGKDREYYERNLRHPRRTPIDPPWSNVNQFRSQAIDALNALIVAHRPEKRRIVGALHKETAHGKASEYPGLYTERMAATKLKSSQFVEPVYDAATKLWKIPGRGQGRAIRDPGLREELAACLRHNGIDPQSFSDNDIKALTNMQDWKLRTSSGVPIKTITTVLAMSDPVSIVGGDGVERYFMGGNNHHMEILLDRASGNWTSVTIPTFDAARMNARRMKALREAGVPDAKQLRRMPRCDREKFRPIIVAVNEQYPIVNRAERDGKDFVMSLCIGETLYLRHKESKQPGYFVVYKLDDKNAYFHPHWDARRASGKTVENPRDEMPLTARQIQQLVVDPKKIKVAVTPLGTVFPLIND